MAGGDGTPLYISNDGGLTWTQDTSAGLQPWSDIAVADDGTATAVTDGGSIYTYVEPEEIVDPETPVCKPNTRHQTDLPIFPRPYSPPRRPSLPPYFFPKSGTTVRPLVLGSSPLCQGLLPSLGRLLQAIRRVSTSSQRTVVASST